MKFQANVRDVMVTDLKAVDIDDSVQKAAQTMRNHRTGSVLVFGEKHLRGILTAEDIVYKHVAEGQGQKVSDIMTRDPLTITPDKTIEDASRLMSSKRVKKLPVMEGNKVVGIITASDIIRIEPALYEVLLEAMKIGGKAFRSEASGNAMVECEVCGNYTDDVREIEGVWTCSECGDK